MYILVCDLSACLQPMFYGDVRHSDRNVHMYLQEFSENWDSASGRRTLHSLMFLVCGATTSECGH